MVLGNTVNRDARGQIMRTLKMLGPQGATERVLGLALDDAQLPVSELEVAALLQYLEDKDYIERESLHDPVYGAMIIFRISAHGVDLIEGNIDADPGVRT
jgi:hypothetical protein